ncbi:MAG: nucleotide exchange factor GrpE [Methanimicrococcus sp.]|nr:nucleotide exchange factor GrpE [Methanimicrococcus sp.]
MKKTEKIEFSDENLSEDDDLSNIAEDIFEDGNLEQESDFDFILKENADLSKRVEELTASYLTLAADFENFKKRSTKHMEDARKFALEQVMKDLIEVLDNFERAIVSSENESLDKNSTIEGIKNTYRQLMTLLESHGLSKIPSEFGMEFDPHFHESILQIPTNDSPEGTIMEVFKSGYALNSKVIRPAMVTVSGPIEDE